MQAGTVIIDMSSINPVESQNFSQLLNKMDVEFLDAPVSGGEPKAIDGSLAIMVGGKKEVFDQYYELLMLMGASATYVGESGAGNIAKLANQIIVALNISALAEALTFAKKAGADPSLVFNAIRAGLAGSTVMEAKAPMMLAHNFKPGFRIKLHIKDLNNALDAGHAINSPLPLTAQAMEMMQYLQAFQFDGEDHSSLLRYYENISGITL